MRRTIDKIEIQEPPIEELKKQRSCLKRSCTTGCGCLMLLLIAAVLILKFTAGPKTKELKKVPENWPSEIPIYDQDNISKITFISGKDRGRAMEYVAMGPKLILSPAFLILEKRFPAREEPKDGRIQTDLSTWENFVRIMKEPIADHRDKIQIEWAELPAEPKFVDAFYQDALKSAGFDINISQSNEKMHQFVFTKENTEGVLYITDDAEKNGTDFVSLTVNIGIEN
jgi:hypothetical protein